MKCSTCANRFRIILGVTAFCWLLGGNGLPAAGASVKSESWGNSWQASSGGLREAVTAVIQSRDGYLWLGTYHGLLRFDGVHFTTFDSGNTIGLQNSCITSLYEDSNETLWIGHQTGDLTCFTNGQFQPVKMSQNRPIGAVEGDRKSTRLNSSH